MVFGLFRHANGRTDNRVRRSPYSHKGNIGESDGGLAVTPPRVPTFDQL